MTTWNRMDDPPPSEGQFIAAITQYDRDVPVEVWEGTLEKNAVGTWIDGVVWEGNIPRRGFTHWLALPDRPQPQESSRQGQFWYWTQQGSLELERRRHPRPPA